MRVLSTNGAAGPRLAWVARLFQAAERERRFGVVLIGVAQEKAIAWRGLRRGGRDSHLYSELGYETIFVNHCPSRTWSVQLPRAGMSTGRAWAAYGGGG